MSRLPIPIVQRSIGQMEGMAMREPGQLDRWVRTRGWKVVLILMVVMTLARIWQMWLHGGG